MATGHRRRPRRAVSALAAAAGLVLALQAPASAQEPRGIPTEMCGPTPPEAQYVDRGAIAPYHLEAVDCLSLLDIARGYQTNEYRPDAEVRRDEMASFVARTLSAAGVDLPASPAQPFQDMAGSPHGAAVAQLAALDVVRGTGGGRYSPLQPVGRDQMASFLTRAAAVQAGVEQGDLEGGDAPFTDVWAGSTHRPAIEGVYELGISNGTGPSTYSPDRAVTREEMASFLARALDAMTERTTVADRDGGGLPHTVFTWPSEAGRCFEVKAGREWASECDPATNETLQLRQLSAREGVSVVVGLASPPVTRVVVESTAGDTIGVELTEVEGGYQAFSSPVLADDVGAVVAFDSSGEVARTPLGGSGLPFPANTLPDTGDSTGAQVLLDDVRQGDHGTYERVVFEFTGSGSAGWRARYVDEAFQQGSGHRIDIEGDAIIELSLRNTAYPTDGSTPPRGRLQGLDVINEVYVASTYEGITQVFIGVDQVTPFRVFGLDDPSRVVLDVVHPSVTG